MGFLMGNDIGTIRFSHVKRQVDHRMDDAQNKGRVYIFALLDAFYQRDRCCHLLFQKIIAHSSIGKHNDKASEPDSAQEMQPVMCLCFFGIDPNPVLDFHNNVPLRIQDIAIGCRIPLDNYIAF